MLPVLIWLVGWFEWWFGIPAAALVVLGLWRALTPERGSLEWQPVLGFFRAAARPTTFFLLLVALAWVMATAAGGVFDVENFDWIKHRAVLLDLARGDWPVYLPAWIPSLSAFFPGDINLTGDLLRYYLGYYIVPGLVGKWFGIGALNWAVPLWTWCGVALLLLMFTREFRGWRVPVAAVVLIFFSGMDIISVLLFEGWEWLDFRLMLDGWPQLWLGRDFLEWDRYWELKVQFLSHMVGMMWVPQHFLAGALYALLLLQLHRNHRFLAISGLVVGASLFWSPFVAVGLLPFVVVLMACNGIRPFLRWQNLLLALPLAIVIFAYLSSGTADIPHFWLWQFAGWQNVLRGLPLLFAIEFLVLAVLLILLRPLLLRDLFFLAAIAVLVLLPLYYFGVHNDLVMRGLIPAIVLLSYYCAVSVLGRKQDRGRETGGKRPVVLTALIALVLGIGALGPILNLSQANTGRDFGVIEYERFGPDYSTAQAVGGSIVNQYLADEVPDWFRGLLRGAPPAPRDIEGELLIRSVFEIYHLDEGIVAFVRSPCSQADATARFLLQAYPVDYRGRAHDSLHFDLTPRNGIFIDDTCVISRALPNYELGRLRAGQFKLNRAGHAWMGSHFSAAYRDRLLAEAGEPVIRGRFDVYLANRSLLFSKAACTEIDVATPFSIQAIPMDMNVLDQDDVRQGFKELVFNFSEHGGWIGKDCFIVHSLPDFDIARIRVGQLLHGGVYLWDGAYSFGD
jgi:hypothetical protein